MGMQVSAATELLINILLGCFCFMIISCVLSGIQDIIYTHRREKREEESAKRDAEYHEQRMKAYLK